MFLVYMRYIDSTALPTFCVLTKTRDEAKHWIDLKMEGKRYNRLGVYGIEEIETWEDALNPTNKNQKENENG